MVQTGRTARMRPDLVPLYAPAAAMPSRRDAGTRSRNGSVLRPLILAAFLAYTIAGSPPCAGGSSSSSQAQ